MSICKGEFVLFVDSDDWIDSNTIEMVLNEFDEQTDIVMFDYVREYGNKSLKREIGMQIKGIGNLNEYVLTRLFGPLDNELSSPDMLDVFNPIWNKVYRRSLIKDIEFVDLSRIGSSEDLLFNIEAFLESKGCKYIDKPFYHYRKNVCSSTTSNYRRNLVEQWTELFNLLYELDKENVYGKSISKRIVYSMLFLGLNEIRDCRYKDKYKRIKKLIYKEPFYTSVRKIDINYVKGVEWKLFIFSIKYKLINTVTILLILISKILNKRK